MNLQSYFTSLTTEIDSLKNRVRNFIDDRHWLTDGEWKESVLRYILARNLPDTVKIGRGFVLAERNASTQCDILLYRATAPILFRDGELVFLTPDSVLGIIEVKSRSNNQNVSESINKFGHIADLMGIHRTSSFFGLFSYETSINHATTLNLLGDRCTQQYHVVDLLSLGSSQFVKWWKDGPRGHLAYNRWHAYHLPSMAAGYFVANVIDFVSPESVSRNNLLWFPEEGKESKKVGEMAFTARDQQEEARPNA